MFKVRSRRPQYETGGFIRYTPQSWQDYEDKRTPDQKALANTKPQDLINDLTIHNSPIRVNVSDTNPAFGELQPRNAMGLPVSQLTDDTVVTIPGSNMQARMSDLMKAGMVSKDEQGNYHGLGMDRNNPVNHQSDNNPWATPTQSNGELGRDTTISNLQREYGAQQIKKMGVQEFNKALMEAAGALPEYADEVYNRNLTKHGEDYLFALEMARDEKDFSYLSEIMARD